ncbi:MAG: hypothetical protein P1U36_04370 [Legionellaceae bacterium]|nr:hypothetical protein [Legionellaceae bacterium]
MPANHRPSRKKDTYTSYQAIPYSLDDEEANVEAPAEKSSSFFSRTTIATTFAAVALAVTAYFAPPLALAATLTLGAAGLVYYGATALFGSSQASTTASTGTETASSTPNAENDAQSEKSLSNSSSYSKLNELPPSEQTKQQTPPAIKQDEQPSEEPVITRKRSDSHDSQTSQGSAPSKGM